MVSAGLRSVTSSTVSETKIEKQNVGNLQNPALNIPAVMGRSLFSVDFEC